MDYYYEENPEFRISIANALNQELSYQLQESDKELKAWKNIAEMAISAFYNDGGWLHVLEEYKKMKPEEFEE